MESLKRLNHYTPSQGPVVLAIMDGIGLGKFSEGDMVRAAAKPNMDWLRQHAIYTELKAHGLAVGMPSDEDMGNSEVGHNAIGAGRVFEQGASLVNQAIESRTLFNGDTWKELIAHCLLFKTALHFIGLLSDGNVHSHIRHLEAMLLEAKKAGVICVRIHILLDGRDVSPTSALIYVDRLEKLLAELNADGSCDYAIASGGGRMNITMDRYEADWDMVKRGWDIHVLGRGPSFASAREAIETHRKQNPAVIDQDLPPFVITRNGKPLGAVKENDSVILFNFRGDRAMELCRAFEEDHFTKFERGPRPNVKFTAMMEYDGDLHIPKKYLVSPPSIDRTMGEYLARAGLRQFAVSETQKYGHVTYFFNGNRTDKFNDDLEDYVEVPSDRVPFEQRPWMKAAEITDKVVEAIRSGKYRFIRLNYPNGDMVGHTGHYQAVKISVEAVDLCLERLIKAVIESKGILVATADHGNADDMYERDKKGNVLLDAQTGMPKPKTSHSLNPVPCYIFDPAGKSGARLSAAKNLGISSLAPTCIKLLGYEPPSGYSPSIIDIG